MQNYNMCKLSSDCTHTVRIPLMQNIITARFYCLNQMSTANESDIGLVTALTRLQMNICKNAYWWSLCVCVRLCVCMLHMHVCQMQGTNCGFWAKGKVRGSRRHDYYCNKSLSERIKKLDTKLPPVSNQMTIFINFMAIFMTV